MPKFIIERDIPGAGNLSRLSCRAFLAKSCGILRDMGPRIQWLHSYASPATRFIASTSPTASRPSASMLSKEVFRANRIEQIKTVIDPTTGD